MFFHSQKMSGGQGLAISQGWLEYVVGRGRKFENRLLTERHRTAEISERLSEAEERLLFYEELLMCVVAEGENGQRQTLHLRHHEWFYGCADGKLWMSLPFVTLHQ